MTSAPFIQPKFLPTRDDLGVVAVGFSGGQVRTLTSTQTATISASSTPSPLNPANPILQPKAGVESGPQALLDAGLIDQLKNDLSLNVTFDGSISSYSSILSKHTSDPDVRGMKLPRTVSGVTQAISEQVYAHASTGRFVLTLGGDHSIAIGTVSGTAKAVRERLGRELAVIWVDAHADINTPESSGSGNIHGMPMAFLTGLAREERGDVFGWLRDEHRVSVKKIVYIGLRDIDAGEKKILREHGIKAFSMHDIDR